MKLKRLIISNFRCLKGDQNIIDFENSEIIFLIGKNNNGKSTFLHGYNFFVEARQKAQQTDFFNSSVDNPIEIIAEFRKNENDTAATFNNEPDWINKWVDASGVIRIKKVWSSPNMEGIKYTFDPSTEEYLEGGFGGFDTLLTKYAPTPIFINAVSTPEDLEKSINDIIAKKHLKKLEKAYEAEYNEIKEKLESLKDKISSAEDMEKLNNEMNEIFSSVFPKLKVEVYSAPGEGIDIAKTLKSAHGFKVKEGDEDFLCNDLKNNGHGVIRQALFSFMSTSEKNTSSQDKEYLILFEEPELFLHPEAVFALREQLYNLAENSPYQILCATHSPAMIDISKPHSSLVRLVREENKRTKTYQVQFDIFSDEEKNYIQMINRFNPHICECFYTDEAILVEGDTEAIIYRELINRFYNDKKKIFVLNTGSKANLVFYQKILTHFGIIHTVVHDCDQERNKKNDNDNPMWTVNESIWRQIEESNNIQPGISKRFVHFQDFESAHGYNYDKAKGKPLSAYLYAQSIAPNSELPAVVLLNKIFNNESFNLSQDELIEKYETIQN